MAIYGTAVIAMLIAGCAASRTSCAVPEEQRAVVLERIAAKIAALSDASTSYDIKLSLLDGQRLYRLNDGHCYAYLFPVSLDDHDILDGDGGIYVDTRTMRMGEVFWFAY